MRFESPHHLVQSQAIFESEDSEKFSRIEFALRVLELLKPNIDVTVYTSLRSLQVRRGRDWAVGPDALWAMVAIPPRASRYHVAYALAELVGRAEQPFVVDLVARVREAQRRLPS